MKSSVKFRAQSPTVAIPDMGEGPGVNDNVPGMLPGHELSDLEGVPRPPAAEAVVYYNRITLIQSFPAHPTEPVPEPALPPAMDAKPERRGGHRKARKGTLSLVCIGSMLFHAAILAAILWTFTVPPDEAEDVAGTTVSVIMLGDSDSDQQSAGAETKDPNPQPEQVTAETVQPDTVQPTETQPEETQPVEPQPEDTPPPETAEAVQPTETTPVQPQDTPPVQPAQPEVQDLSPETVTTPEPEVLAATPTATPSEDAVVQPQATEVQPTEVQPTETAQIPPPADVVTPTEKPPVPTPPVDKRKDVVKKQPPKRVKVKSGSNGEGDRDSRRGSVDGQEQAKSNDDSQAAAGRQGTGTADVASYLGKLRSSVNRCIQRLPERLRTQEVTLRIAMTVDGSGNISGVRANSGLPELDAKAAELIRSCSVPGVPADIARTKTINVPVLVSPSR